MEWPRKEEEIIVKISRMKKGITNLQAMEKGREVYAISKEKV